MVRGLTTITISMNASATHTKKNLQSGKQAKKPDLSNDKSRGRRLKKLENKKSKAIMHNLQTVLGFPDH